MLVIVSYIVNGENFEMTAMAADLIDGIQTVESWVKGATTSDVRIVGAREA